MAVSKLARDSLVEFRVGKHWCSEDISGTFGRVEEIHDYPDDVVEGGAVYGVRRLTCAGHSFGGLTRATIDELKPVGPEVFDSYR